MLHKVSLVLVFSIFLAISFNVQSPIIFPNATAQESFFSSDKVELIEIDLGWELGGAPTDITEDGKKILLFSGCKDIALFDTDTNQIQHVNSPLELEEYKCLNPQLHFSKSNDNEIFFVFEKNLYKSNLESDSTEKILEDVHLIDVIEDDKILFLYFDDYWNYLEQKHTVWYIDEQGAQPKKFLDLEAGQRISDVSSDGTKLLLVDVTEEYRDVDKFTSFVDVQSGDSFQIPEINAYCGRTPDFITNTELMVYTKRGCDQYPDETLYIADMKGNSEQIFWEEAGKFPIIGYLVSPDGKFLYFSIVGQGLYKMPLASAMTSDLDSLCSQVSEKNPIIVTTDRQNYNYYDDKMVVSICMMPDVYHKHMEMAIYDLHGTEVYQIYDPGLIWGESLEQEPYFFVQEVPMNSFEKWQKHTIEVHASGLTEIAYFGYGADLSQEYFNEKYNYYIYPTLFWKLSDYSNDEIVRFDAETVSDIEFIHPYFEITKLEPEEEIKFGDRVKLELFHTQQFKIMVQNVIGRQLDFESDTIRTDAFPLYNEFLHTIEAEIKTPDNTIEIDSTIIHTDANEIFDFTLYGTGPAFFTERYNQFIDSVNTFSPLNEKQVIIPDWIRNNAKWWSEGAIGDSDFTSGIQFMIKENIISIPDLPEQASETTEGVPKWVRNNAGWWADGLISDDDFVSGIKYLVEQGIISV